MSPATTGFYTAVIEGKLTHDADPGNDEFTRPVVASVT